MYKVKTLKTIKGYVSWNQGIIVLLNSAKAPSVHVASPRDEAMTSAKSRLTNASKGKSKAKSNTIQPIRANLQPPRASVLGHLGPTNTDLRKFLSHK